jgi:hypothetical protein
VGAAHSALGRGLSIFLYGHVLTLCLEYRDRPASA